MSYGFDNIAKVPELQKRIIFTLLMLFVYRMGIHIPTPGIDSTIMKEWFDLQQGTLLGMFDMFTGGGFRSLSIFALGCYALHQFFHYRAAVVHDLSTL